MIFNAASVTVLFVLVSFFPPMIYGDSDGPTVVTSLGTIRGLRASDGNYSMFLGIPFAKVNESNPFGDAMDIGKFETVFEANDDDKPCPQEDENGSLDCLILNIYVPDSVNKPLPVMMYIFGGRFDTGTPSKYKLGPNFFMEHQVILVVINYRLGPFGFMCLHTREVPGNQGLRDQSRGMRWVKKHGASFGGDPNKITLFGSSSGAISVDYHVLSEEEPVYHNVILQSGTAFGIPLMGANPGNLFAITENLGLNTTDYVEAIEFLSNLDSHKIIQAYVDTKSIFAPCVEIEIEGVQRMISGNAVNLPAPKAKSLNIMIGLSDDERLVLYTFAAVEFPSYVNLFRDKLRELFNFDNETLARAEKIVRNFYMGDKEFTEDVRFALAELDSDLLFIYSTRRSIRQYLQSGAERIYFYLFTYVGRRNHQQLPPNVHFRGAYHADELGYLFDGGYIKETPTAKDQLVIDRLLTLWTNFAKYSNPTPERTELLPIEWEPITQGSVYYYLNITIDMNMGRIPFHRRMAFWDMFYTTYGQYERARYKVNRS